jgi:hypothetical protein
MAKFRILASAITLAAVAFSCGKKQEKESSGEAATVIGERDSAQASAREGEGCVQGAVVDGTIGKKVNLQDEPGLGVFVLIRGIKFKAAIVQNPSSDKEAELSGEYYICGIPLNETYLIFAHFDRFLPFQSDVRIESTTLTAEKRDIVKKDPVLLANIRVFPKGEDVTKDLKVMVYNNAEPVADAMVQIEPAGSNRLFDKDGFLRPNDARLVPLPENVTDAKGTVTFPKDQLVLGAEYLYRVVPKGAAGLSVVTGRFVLGATAAPSSKDYFEFTVNLSTTMQPLSIASCSTSESPVNASGVMKIVFSREVDLVDLDDPKATLVDASARGGNDTLDKAELAADAANNDDISEQVNVQIAGKVMTLSPKFNPSKKEVSEASDPGLTINYDAASIKVRVKSKELDLGPQSLQSLIGSSVAETSPITGGTPAPSADPGAAPDALQSLNCPTTVNFFVYKGVPK